MSIGKFSIEFVLFNYTFYDLFDIACDKYLFI